MRSRSAFIALRALVILCITGADCRAVLEYEPWEITRETGNAARKQGNYTDARRYLEAALAALERQPPFDDKDARRAELLDELGSVCQTLGDMAAADRLLAEAADTVRNRPRIPPDLQANVLGDLALLRAREGRFDEASVVLEAALTDSLNSSGDHSMPTAELKSNLGQVRILQGRLHDSEQLLHEAVSDMRKSLPPGHLNRIVSETSLGDLYMLEQRYGDAETVLQQAANDARQLGEMHPVHASALAILADLYRLEGKQARGEPLLKKAQAIYETAVGPDSPRVAEVLLDRSIDDDTARKFALAEAEIRRSLDILRKTQGLENPTGAVAEFRLGRVLREQGKYSEAEPLLKHAIAGQEKTWPEGHYLLGDSLLELAELEKSQHRYAEAEVQYQKVIMVYEKSGPMGTARLAVALQQYASLLRIGRNAEAKALEKRAQVVRRSVQAFR